MSKSAAILPEQHSASRPFPSLPRLHALQRMATRRAAEASCNPGTECGSITVPKDYFSAAAGTVSIAFAVLKATKSPRKGTVFLNPDGPGGSGMRLAAPQFADIIGHDWDLVGFDHKHDVTPHRLLPVHGRCQPFPHQHGPLPSRRSWGRTFADASNVLIAYGYVGLCSRPSDIDSTFGLSLLRHRRLGNRHLMTAHHACISNTRRSPIPIPSLRRSIFIVRNALSMAGIRVDAISCLDSPSHPCIRRCSKFGFASSTLRAGNFAVEFRLILPNANFEVVSAFSRLLSLTLELRPTNCALRNRMPTTASCGASLRTSRRARLITCQRSRPPISSYIRDLCPGAPRRTNLDDTESTATSNATLHVATRSRYLLLDPSGPWQDLGGMSPPLAGYPKRRRLNIAGSLLFGALYARLRALCANPYVSQLPRSPLRRLWPRKSYFKVDDTFLAIRIPWLALRGPNSHPDTSRHSIISIAWQQWGRSDVLPNRPRASSNILPICAPFRCAVRGGLSAARRDAWAISSSSPPFVLTGGCSACPFAADSSSSGQSSPTLTRITLPSKISLPFDNLPTNDLAALHVASMTNLAGSIASYVAGSRLEGTWLEVGAAQASVERQAARWNKKIEKRTGAIVESQAKTRSRYTYEQKTTLADGLREVPSAKRSHVSVFDSEKIWNMSRCSDLTTFTYCVHYLGRISTRSPSSLALRPVSSESESRKPQRAVCPAASQKAKPKYNIRRRPYSPARLQRSQFQAGTSSKRPRSLSRSDDEDSHNDAEPPRRKADAAHAEEDDEDDPMGEEAGAVGGAVHDDDKLDEEEEEKEAENGMDVDVKEGLNESSEADDDGEDPVGGQAQGAEPEDFVEGRRGFCAGNEEEDVEEDDSDEEQPLQRTLKFPRPTTVKSSSTATFIAAPSEDEEDEEAKEQTYISTQASLFRTHL
uniref:Uncharacterized protein n=1 Tax=Mycena chlorophos TaxID=658473 RepID=A0ABQ0L855_MYCCL|nr:predicted protein [Mycena chlorophos]